MFTSEEELYTLENKCSVLIDTSIQSKRQGLMKFLIEYRL